MKDTPYVNIIKIMQERGAKYNPPEIELGQVICGNPLNVTVGDLQLAPDNLLIPTELKQGYTKTFEVDGIEKTFTVKNEFNKGDIVALYPVNNLTFIIIGKYERP